MRKIDPIYGRMASMIMPKLHLENTKYFPRILEKLADVEQARILLALPDQYREAVTGRLEVSEEFARRLNLDRLIVVKHIRELFEKGLVFPSKRGPRMALSVIQLHDAQTNPKYDQALSAEYFDLWEKFLTEEWHKAMGPEMTDLSLESPAIRTLPNPRAIEDVPGVLPCEDLGEILKAQDIIAVHRCSCRRLFPHRQCGTPDEICVTISRTAQYNIDRGVARRLTAEEALRLLEEVEKYPVIHTTPNQKEAAQVICTDHWCCCELFGPNFKNDQSTVRMIIAKSRFEAVVDATKCVGGCTICAEMCQFGCPGIKYYPELGDERIHIDTEKCMGCGCCVVNCPSQALSLKLVRPPQHIPDSAMLAYHKLK